MISCTIVDNLTDVGGAIFIVEPGYSDLTNCIIWRNSPEQINGNPTINYSAVEQPFLYPGEGNINQDPRFISPEFQDYRLQWGSPCIDSGRPQALYNDPDSTAADMGGFYYDQSIPLRILLTPHDPYAPIPSTGGVIEFTAHLTSIDPDPSVITSWLEMQPPGSGLYEPLGDPVTTPIDSGTTRSQTFARQIPGWAEAGMYRVRAQAVSGPDTSFDSFSVEKLEQDFSVAGNIGNVQVRPTSSANPSNHALLQVYPNPFNPTTTLRLNLPAAAPVKAYLTNLKGEIVTRIYTGFVRQSETEFLLDGTNLPSGVYIIHLGAGNSYFAESVVLLK